MLCLARPSSHVKHTVHMRYAGDRLTRALAGSGDCPSLPISQQSSLYCAPVPQAVLHSLAEAVKAGAHVHILMGPELLEASSQLAHEPSGCGLGHALVPVDVGREVSTATVLHYKVQLVARLRQVLKLSRRWNSSAECRGLQSLSCLGLV